MTRETGKQVKPSDMSVELKLKTLYQLQTVLSKIDEIRTMRGELPLEVQDMEDELEGLNNRMVKLQEDMKAINANISKWNQEKLAAQANIDKNTVHLDNIRNSREYDAIAKEIEFQNLEIQLRDKKIREAGDNKNNCTNAIGDCKQQQQNLANSLNEKKNELDEIIEETKAQEDTLLEKSKALEEKIDPRLLQAFKRIRKNSHNGLGIVYVQRDACGGCFNKIPPQRQLDVRMRKKIIVCEYCGRIMIDPELAGIHIQKPAEEEPKKVRRRRTTATAKETTQE